MRTKPHFGKKEAVPSRNNHDSEGCVRIPLFIVLSYFAIKAIVSYTSGSGSKLDQMICFGALIVFVVVMLLGFNQWTKEGLEINKEKQRWKSTCKSAEVAIVNRHSFPGGSFQDEYGIPHTARADYSLTLRLPNQVDVKIEVSERVFAKLEQRNIVRIYYKPEEPLTFLLEEEMTNQT